MSEIAGLLAVGEKTIRDWRHAFLVRGVDSLVYRRREGRPPKLTTAQRAELKDVVLAGPEAAG